MYSENMDWLKCKRYVHMDLPYGINEEGKVLSYVSNPQAVRSHAFLPLIRRVVKTYRFKTDCGKRVRKDVKKRCLTFASHLDAAIFGYYANSLQKEYERKLRVLGLDDVVTAYRKIECVNRKGNKCNIDMANEIFQYIKKNVTEENPLAIITFDIKGFFDNLDHKLLKNSWKEVLGVSSMSDDLFAVYKATTQYSYVYENEVFKHFKDKIICRNKNLAIVSRKVKHIRYLHDKGAIAFCRKDDIKEIRESHLINMRSKKEKAGIPQGLPISAVLANVYMLSFDNDAKQYISLKEGVYRRYSDDIIVVCPLRYGKEVKVHIMELIKNVKLEIEPKKTNLFCFEKCAGDIVAKHDIYGTNKKLEYLGFSFDGRRIMLKDASIGRFYGKMRRSVRYAIRSSSHIQNHTRGILFENKLIYRYTYAGSLIRPLYTKSKKNGKFHRLKGVVKFGNYLTYVKKSANVTNSTIINKQLRHCTNILSKKINMAKVAIQKNKIDKDVFQYLKYGRIY